MKYSRPGLIDPLRKNQLIQPIVVDEAHSSHTSSIYTVTLLARLHALKVCLAAVKKVYSVAPRDKPQMMEDNSMSAAVG